jgi:hypothetical protein
MSPSSRGRGAPPRSAAFNKPLKNYLSLIHTGKLSLSHPWWKIASRDEVVARCICVCRLVSGKRCSDHHFHFYKSKEKNHWGRDVILVVLKQCNPDRLFFQPIFVKSTPNEAFMIVFMCINYL